MIKLRLMTRLLVGGCCLALSGSALAFPSHQDNNTTQQKAEAKKPAVTVLRRVDPVYPQEAQDANVSGKVVLDVVVETSGEVSMATVVNGHRLLNQAAIDAVKQWRFSNTYDAPVTLQLTIVFGDPDAAPNQKSDVKPTRKVEATYPDEAQRKRVQGEVAVAITIDEKGEVVEAHAQSGEKLLRQAAVDAAKQFQFANPLRQTVQATLTFNFVLDEKNSNAPRKPQQ